MSQKGKAAPTANGATSELTAFIDGRIVTQTDLQPYTKIKNGYVYVRATYLDSQGKPQQKLKRLRSLRDYDRLLAEVRAEAAALDARTQAAPPPAVVLPMVPPIPPSPSATPASSGVPNNLRPADLQALAKSYITPDVALRAGIQRVDSVDGAQLVGRQARNGHDFSGLVFPYVWPGEQNSRLTRLRRDHPDLEAQPDGGTKEKNKYLSPPGSFGRGTFYFPPNTPTDWLQDTAIPVTFTEGEKKALALGRFHTERSEPRLVISIPGVWNWRGVVGIERDSNGHEVAQVKGPIPDFDRVAWQGREVFIVFDANAATNPSVKQARTGLARLLSDKGATVRVVDLPGDLPGVNGVDDLLGAKGPDFVAGLFAKVAQAEAKKGKQKRAQVGSVVFTNSDTGVWADDEEGDKTWVCSELSVEADTRDERGENWGRLLRFRDRDDVWHQWAMPMELLAGDGREVRQELLRQGVTLGVTTKARRLLEQYLNSKPEQAVLCVSKQGWHRGAFVLPDETIGENGEPIYLQTLSANHLFRQAGTLDE